MLGCPLPFEPEEEAVSRLPLTRSRLRIVALDVVAQSLKILPGRYRLDVDQHSPDRSASVLASVVVPTRNRPAMLTGCLHGLLAQDLETPYEVVIIDDGPSQETQRVVEAAQRVGRRNVSIEYRQQSSLGLNAARNHGVRSSLGELICFVDDDVETPPGWLRALTGGALGHPEADLLGGPILLRIEGREPPHCAGDRLPETHLDRGERLVWDEKLFGANVASRRRAFERFGKFNESLAIYGDEEEWEDRVLAGGGHTLYLPDAWLWHRRTQQELAPLYLIRRSYSTGYNQVPYRLSSGGEVTLVTELTRVARGLVHALRLGCFYGLLRACRHWGATRRLWAMRTERAA